MNRLRGLIWFGWAAVLGAQVPSPRPASYTPEDLAQGRQLFEAQCSPCHGLRGTGGRGANLARPTLKHAADDTALFSVIRDGIDNTGMPAIWQMTDHEVWLVIAYIRSLARVAVEKLAGDPAQGQALFASHGCGTCHMVNGDGGSLGPELDAVGARRSSERLRECLLAPGNALPDGFMMVRAVRGDGSAVEGIRVNEDSFTIQIRDAANRFYSFRKRELQTLEYQSKATPMPSYRNQLAPREIDDLVAYLAGLRGKP